MKTQLNRLAGRRAFRLGVPLTTTLLLLAALPVADADTPYTQRTCHFDVTLIDELAMVKTEPP